MTAMNPAGSATRYAPGPRNPTVVLAEYGLRHLTEEEPMAARIDLTLDCANPARLAAFWKLALGYEDEPPPAPFTTREEWLQEYGDPGDTADDGAWLHDPDGNGPRLSLLRVPEPKTAKNRLHIDIRAAGTGSTDDRWARITQAASRLAAAGATSLREYPGDHIVMADPEGNEFCVG